MTTAGLAATLLVQACSREVVGVSLGSISVSPSSAAMVVGESRSFSAQVRDTEGAVVPGIAVTWSTTPSSILSVNAEGQVQALSSGEAEVVATAQGVTGSATVQVEAEPSIVPTPAEVELFASVGQDSPDPLQVDVTNGGAGDLTGLSASVEYAAGQPGGWLSPSLSASTAPAVLTLTSSTGSLPVGEFQAAVLIASPVASNAPVTVQVRLSVSEDRPLIGLVPSAVGMSAVSGGSAPPAQIVEVRNTGGGTLAELSASVTYPDVGGWLTATLAAATGPTELALTADPAALAPGTYRADVRVESPTALNSPRNLAVTLNVVAEPEADLEVAKEGTASVIVGDTARFVLHLANHGPQGALDVELRDSLPDDFELVEASGGGVHANGVVTWAIGTLSAGATRSDTVRAVATAVGTRTNVARASTSTLDPEGSNDRAEWEIEVEPVPANLSIEKTGPATAGFGDAIEYVLTTTNDGPGPAGQVLVTDSLPDLVTLVSTSAGSTVTGSVVAWAVDTLEVGATRRDTVRVEVTGSGTLTNVARVRASTPDPVAADNRAVVTTSVDRLADLSIAKAGPETVMVGETAVYALTTTNAGPDAAAAVVVTDSLPSGMSFVSASGGATASGAVVTWPSAELAAGATRSDTVRLRADAAGTSVDVARVTSPTDDPDLADRRATHSTVVRASDLSVAKTATASVGEGGTIVYVLTVRNDGPDAAPSVELVDSLPASVSFVSASGSPVVSGRAVTWSKGTIPAGATRVDTVRAIAEVAGEVVNVARVSGGLADPTPDDRRATATTTVAGADLSIAKTGPAEVSIAQVITYQITLENSGPGRARSVTVRDSLPSGVVFLSASGGGTLSGSVVTWNYGNLNAGATRVETLRVLALLFGTRTNVVRASSATPDPDSDDLRATVTTTVGGADLSVTKSGPDKVGLGDTITYLLGLDNAGPGAASNVVTTDSLPPSTTVVGTSPGATVTGTTVTWTRSSVAAGATIVDTLRLVPNSPGPITNVVRVSSTTGDSDTDDLRADLRTVVTGADLSVSKSGPSAANLGDIVPYVLTVTNAGPDSANAVTLVDSLPPGMTFASATGGGTISGTAVSWSLGKMAASTQRSETVQLMASSVGAPTNVARAHSPTPDPDLADRRATASTTITASADLSLTKTAEANVGLGDTIRYVLTISNSGPSSATDVSLIDSLPAGVSFMSATGGAAQSGVLVTWPSKATVPSGGSTVDTMKVVATAPGTIRNVARVSSPTPDPDVADLRATWTTTTSAADLSLTKTAEGTVVLGDTIRYVLTLANGGPNPATGVVLVDSLPAGVTFVSATNGGTLNGTAVTWSKGTISNGGGGVDTIKVVTTIATSVTNVARVSSDTADPDAADRRATATTNVVMPPPAPGGDSASPEHAGPPPSTAPAGAPEGPRAPKQPGPRAGQAPP
jgi:uncharacterized repeat protein (TIGR01451 family)